ncbi:hypothetical protein Tco_0139002 [Tanacetum coccineum]
MVESVVHLFVGLKLEKLKSSKRYAKLKRETNEFKSGIKLCLSLRLERGRRKSFECVAYKLELSEELSSVHNTFHVSNMKKAMPDESLAVLLDGLHFDDKLQFVEEPVEIMDPGVIVNG